MGGILDKSENVLKKEIKSNYEVLEKIEDNCLSIVLKAKEKKTNTLVAIRIYLTKYLERVYGSDKLEFAKSNIRNEIEYLRICDGDYSLHLIEELEHPECFNIVTEFCDTTLEKHVINLGGALTIKEIKEIYSKLNIAFREMYNNDIIHGDLTLKNILVKYKEDESIIPKIRGYGKKIIFNEKLDLMHSEPYYAAPEVLRGEKYTYKIDLWSLGVMLYRLYFGEVPYKGKTQVAVYNNIMNQVKIKKKGKNDLFDDLISKLLQINPNLRMDWEEYFAHDFWKVKDPEEDSESEENEINDENFNNSNVNNNINGNSSPRKNINNNNNNKNNDDENKDEIKDKEKEEELKKNKEEENKNNKLKYNIFYSFNREENAVEVNPFVISQNLEEFPISTKNRLKKLEVYLNKEDIKDDNNPPANLKQEIEMINNYNNDYKLLKSDLLLNDLIKKVKNKYLYKLILYGCRLNEIEALSNSVFKNLTELDLSNNLLNNLEIFKKPSFRNLISLNLNHNKIRNIDPLMHSSFKYLTNLNLANNKISNLDIFTTVPFVSLEKLNLSSNLISNLEVFQNVPFSNLTHLNISDNKIEDNKSSLSEINLPNLRILDLSHNKISDIKGLTSKQYQRLTMLNLGKNKINNIDILSRAPFIELKIFLLYDNQISDINVFKVPLFSNLSYLNLSYNDISDITVLTNVPFNNLTKLDLSGNTISNIDPLLRMPINDIREFYIKNNKIEKNVFNQNVFEEMKKKYKHIIIN